MNQATHRIVLVMEGRGDLRAAQLLLDRWILQWVEWVDESTIDSFRSYTGLEQGEEWLDLHTIPKIAREHRIRSLRGRGEALLVRRLLLLLRERTQAGNVEDGPLVVVYLRDTDGDDRRRSEAEHGANGLLDDNLVWLPGFPHEAMEAWVLLGWTPRTEEERRAHRAEKTKLPFDPLVTPHRLSHKEIVPKSAKDLLRRLGVDRARQEHCLMEASERGGEAVDRSGLGEFRRRVRAWLRKIR